METAVRQAPGRILALDVGDRRIGLAVSDELGLTAQGLPTLERKNLRVDLARLAEIARERGATLLLVGNPIRLDGREGDRSRKIRDFADRLAGRVGLPCELWDERFTSVEAERLLREGGVTRRSRPGAVDQIAAVLILENYLEAARHREAAAG